MAAILDAKLKIEKRGKKKNKNLLLWTYWANLNQTLLKWFLGGPLPKLWSAFQNTDQDGLAQWFLRRRFLCEFPIGSYVKLSSAVGVILVEGPNRPTHFWKRTIQWLFHQKDGCQAKNRKKEGMKLKKNLLLWNYWANLNQTLLKWSFGGPLSKLCPSAPFCIQDGRHD
jgi:IS1 family transposase